MSTPDKENSGISNQVPVTPVSGKIQQLKYESQVSLTQGIKNSEKIDRLEIQIRELTEGMKSAVELIKFQAQNQTEIQSKFDNSLNSMIKGINTLVKSIKEQNDSPDSSSSVDSDGDTPMKLYDLPQNHLTGGDSFKGTELDLDRFKTMCRRQFHYYDSYYSNEKKRVEFIESHLGPATTWFHAMYEEDQLLNLDSKTILDDLTSYYFTDLPEVLKLRKLRKLSHKWGNAVDFIAKFKLYSKSLNIPEILQLEFFEEQVQPLVKKKLLELDPNKRNMETYCRMLVNLDCNRERFWDSNTLHSGPKIKGDFQKKGNSNSRSKFYRQDKNYEKTREETSSKNSK
ncbi:hypothetical protein PIROE2DRAFT_65590 [Piromyces sp. E2]|nr:hypothetical protein PIROE2DRAFT_65590 [Piromyces sp. E2]|eukprot:OUM56335.1 hypothetical protein PIROE2DRAFT_65590 [Piromyces sp. E2]